MKKMRVCFGLGLNFAGMSHQVMPPASRWFSGCFGEGAWQDLELLLMSCWFKGFLCFAFLSALLHTHHTHKFPFYFPSVPRALYMLLVVSVWLLLELVLQLGRCWSSHSILQITPLCGAWGLFCSISPLNQGWLESAGSWKAVLWVRASSPSAIAAAKARGAGDVLIARAMLGNGGCQVFPQHQRSGIQRLLLSCFPELNCTEL